VGVLVCGFVWVCMCGCVCGWGCLRVCVCVCACVCVRVCVCACMHAWERMCEFVRERVDSRAFVCAYMYVRSCAWLHVCVWVCVCVCVWVCVCVCMSVCVCVCMSVWMSVFYSSHLSVDFLFECLSSHRVGWFRGCCGCWVCEGCESGMWVCELGEMGAMTDKDMSSDRWMCWVCEVCECVNGVRWQTSQTHMCEMICVGYVMCCVCDVLGMCVGYCVRWQTVTYHLTHVSVIISHMCLSPYTSVYGLPTSSRLLKIIGLFCRI